MLRKTQCLLTVLGSMAASTQALAETVPPASFLNYHVSTAKGLSEEVAQDVVVRARLARHFHMAEPAVYEYVRRNLVERPLTPQQAGEYRVACIGSGGHEYFVTERLRAGTPVFVLASTGQPILKLECGNPLVSALPAVQAMSMPKVGPWIASEQTALPQPVTMASSVGPQEAFAAPPALTGYEFTGVGPVVNVGGFTQALTHGGDGSFLQILGALGASSALFMTASGGHGGGHPGDATPVRPAPAPEPGATWVVGLGTITLAGLRLRASRRRASPSA